MTTAEKLFLSIIKTGDVESMGKIKTDWIDVKEMKQYRYILDHFKTVGVLPPETDFIDKFDIEPTRIVSKPVMYLKELRERYVFTSLAENIPGIMTGVKKGAVKALDQLRELIGNLEVEDHEARDMRYDAVDSRLADYTRRKLTKGVTHLSAGLEVLDKYWYGYGKADLITIAGRAGLGKTWMLIFLALKLADTLTEDQGDVLFISNEMPEDEIADRFDAVKFKLPYAKFLKGELSRVIEAKYRKGLERLKARGSKITFVYNCNTLEMLRAKIDLYKPSAVFIDGSYLMLSKRASELEKIMEITRGLKRTAKDTGTPIVNTTQLRKGTGKSKASTLDGQDELAYGGSYIQDSDLVLRMFQNTDMVYENVIGLDHVKGRRLPPNLTLYLKLNLDGDGIQITEDEDSSPEDDEMPPPAPPAIY